ncbi:hypothetical protein E1281_14115 [Actinomadura sp. KC345]|uniref:hypothetical protein n=1 Tax=Actinomadura sp. KC345 TaxID=2530371 RepID=UPI00104C7635|nr:hypothetical protein [Actinomadura sp. KC345]TDC55145.1 hypothetical protein E1281_14115 [Actinomadura sp. KC345]
MIILSGVLVVVAMALLVAGIVAGNSDSAEVFGQFDALFVIYISIAVSIVSALCLALGVFLRRKELFGPSVATAPARKSKATKARKDQRGKAAPAAKAKGAPEAKAPADPADDEVEIPAPPADVPDDALVFVVRGRKRYHLDTCRQLAGRETEELTYAEAKEEGFSPCTACMPDTALAARAAASGPASPDAGKKAAGDAPVPAKPGVERSGDGLAGLAKPAPSPAAAATSFDKTAEIPRAGEPERPGRAGETGAEREPERPAGPTLTDLPVASIFAPAEPAGRAEKAENAGPEPEERSAGERAADAGSAAPDATGDAAPTSPASPEAEAAPDATAPKPRDAEDEDVPAPQAADEPEPEPAAASPAAEPADDGPQVRILSGTKRYHRVDCALIEDIGDEADDLESLSRAEAKSRGCTPCLVCQPDRERARD